MQKRNKALNENQVNLPKAVMCELEARAENTGICAYQTAVDMLRIVLEQDYATAAYVIPTMIHASIADIDVSTDKENLSLTEYELLLFTVKTDGTDESKNENLRRWNRQDEI